MSTAIPEGFERLKRGGPYMAGLGDLYLREDEERIVIAIRVAERHTNMRGIAHGGMLASLADTALGIGLTLSCEARHSFVTVSLTTDYLEAARPGDWLEAHVQVDRIGGRVAFAGCRLRVGEKAVLRAAGVFAVMAPLTPAQLAAGY
ncbi:PaaI family thioesterase [Pseudoduganella armeniaca]|uniref:PaaI family thioesterase n=1 Tax=Pseudoduganella armeniaca TaxID=2072590 RepID=A0A2R4CFM1_9BURK|nr:PaaI family thioesterase [Pseudoduganella armeniaca]AVR98429.1 PaaI family thioesterase [Pseudoduganella armeniaca]